MRDLTPRHPVRAAAARVAGTLALALAALAPAAPAAAAPGHPASVPASGRAAAGVDDFEFASFHADYRLDRGDDGRARLDVTETLVAVFPDIDQNHGIERAIPRSYQRASLGLEIRSVRDADGHPLPYTLIDDGDFLVVRIGSADVWVHGEQSYVIEYGMRDVVRSFSDTGVDELYWDINGTGSPQRYGTVSAELELSPALRGTPTGDAACYVGVYGADDTCPIEVTADGASVSVADVGPYQTVTLSIAFPAGTFRTPALPADSWIVRVVPWVLVGVVGACLLIVLWLRIRVFRDAPGRGIVVPQFEPFPELGIMEAAVLLRRQPRDLPAQFVQLVVMRAARLVDRGADAAKNRRYRLELLDTSMLDRDDAIAVATLFGGTGKRTGIDLDTKNQRLGDRVQSLRSKVQVEVSKRYLRRIRSRWTAVVRIALALNGVAAVFVAFWAGETGASSPSLIVQLVAVFLVGLVLMGFAGSPEVLTREGALAREHLDGIRDYLELAEADRIRVLQGPETAERTLDPDDREEVVRLYERLLPYAMLFGIEDRWQRELGTLYETTPTELAPVLRATPVSSFVTGYSAARFATTPPPSSSSSWSGSGGSSSFGGSSGGGFSGGGGGGGGARGW